MEEEANRRIESLQADTERCRVVEKAQSQIIRNPLVVVVVVVVVVVLFLTSDGGNRDTRIRGLQL
jgi:hypothetical protein